MWQMEIAQQILVRKIEDTTLSYVGSVNEFILKLYVRLVRALDSIDSWQGTGSIAKKLPL
jgi:hypothetical protein